MTTAEGPPAARRPLVSGNWKMHHDHIEALHTVRDLGLRLKPADVAAVDVSVHPPFTDLRTVQTVVEGESIPVALGAQHCHEHDRGAFTGEVSPQMLARLGVRYVIVGPLRAPPALRHDRRGGGGHPAGRAPPRHDADLLRRRDGGGASRPDGPRPAWPTQMRAALDGLPAEQVAGLVVAYEPIWAIGTGTAATTVDAEDACVFIRGLVGELAGPEAAAAVRIQYGGSVNAENAAELVAEPDVDGLLVGGASLEAGTFLDILRAVGGCYRS